MNKCGPKTDMLYQRNMLNPLRAAFAVQRGFYLTHNHVNFSVVLYRVPEMTAYAAVHINYMI